MSHQDWRTVSWDKRGRATSAAEKPKEINEAKRRGDDVETTKRYMGGQNKSNKPVLQNQAKIEEDTGDYHVDRVGCNFAKSLQQARTAKKMTQVQLAQKINEKPTVVHDYESGKAVPNQQVVQKLNRALGVQLPSPTK